MLCGLVWRFWRRLGSGISSSWRRTGLGRIASKAEVGLSPEMKMEQRYREGSL